MKKIYIISSLLLFSLTIISFALVPILTEHVSGSERYRNSITQTFNTTVSPSSATLYYGLSTSVVSPAGTELRIVSNPKFTSQGSLEVNNSDTFKSFHADGLEPDVSYNLYTLLVDNEGEESSIFSKTIESINYVTEAVYDANKLSNLNDDTITIKFYDDFIYEAGYTDFNIHVGYFNITDYEDIALNPPSEGALNPITILNNSSFSNITNTDSKTIELTVDPNSLTLYNNEAQWLVNNPTFARVMVNDTNSADTFEMDGGLYFMPMTYEIITNETYPELKDFTYQNSSGFTNDTMTLKFNKSVQEYITKDDIIITFDDLSDGSYNHADYTLTSSDFTISHINEKKLLIRFTTSGASIIENLESDTVLKVQINNNGSNNFIMDPTNNNLTLNMPGQNAKLKDIKFHDSTLTGFSPTQYSYYINASANDYDEAESNPLEFISYAAIDPNASVTATSPSTGIYDIQVLSADTKESSMYSIDLMRIENRLSDIQVNGSSIVDFSPNTFEYTFNVESSFRVSSVTATAINQNTAYTVEYSGSQPGTYVVTILATHSDSISSYKLNYISSTDRSSSSSHSSSSSSSKDDNTKSTKQLITNVTSNLNKLIADEEQLADPASVEKLVSSLDDLTSGVDTNAEAVQATNDLLILTSTLSKKVLETDEDKENVLKILEEIGKSMTNVISKFDNPNDKLDKLSEFTSSLREVKNSDINTNNLDKSIRNIISDTNSSLNTVNIKTPEISSSNEKSFVITGDIISKSDEGSSEKLNELRELADKYFEEENYIDIKKEVAFSVNSDDDLTNISLDKEAVKKLKDSNITTVNITVGDTTIALPSELLNSDDNYQLVVKKLSPSSQLKRDEKVKTNVDTLTNNKRYVDVSILKNGSEFGNLQKPVELRLDTNHFGIEDIDSKTETLTILRYNDETGIWEYVGGIYDPITKTISVHRIHLSKYTVMKTKKTITDVENNEVKSEVLALLNKGIISDEKANMDDNITREEFVTWLGKSYGLASSAASTPFDDLDPDSESYKFVASVYEQGIISGKSNDKFGTDDFITYQEVAVVLSNTLTTFDNKKINNNLTKKLSQMGEDVNVSKWAEDEIALIIELGIMDDSVALKADGYITREEAATIFDKFYS